MSITINGNGTITGISAGGLPAGSVTSATLANSVAQGITQADQWRVTSSFDTADSDVTSNWARNNTDFALIGSGMTESSGIFTFPVTGIYKIEFVPTSFKMPSGATLKEIGGYIYTTTDNSNYNIRAKTDNSISTDNYASSTCYMSCIFDVQNTSTHRCFFGHYDYHHGSTTFYGHSDKNYNAFTFIKLGDT